MANGWAQDGAVQDQIDDTVSDAVSAARARMPSGESARYCAICGDDIPEPRRRALPGVRTCVPCQSDRDANVRSAGINRRGSKDSQLR
ncbi:DksA/TraR family C4-type zinc finger protein [Sphingomonas sp. DG1-23]|uniref:DksA/TraR family C4-type zinc finger protein n=1 Tax=Sphingomonas sp. DG1-23 TaxID=3068316 RepID=UPI00273F87ED|nr:DksA/TraR family C4-type zinc finger protein [Sphingomonas sp. DG1-23]MDP5277381.1 DksA/TraR family C4-type zinc finger protein [Sphingomonas sp. DG1-23]